MRIKFTEASDARGIPLRRSAPELWSVQVAQGVSISRISCRCRSFRAKRFRVRARPRAALSTRRIPMRRPNHALHRIVTTCARETESPVWAVSAGAGAWRKRRENAHAVRKQATPAKRPRARLADRLPVGSARLKFRHMRKCGTPYRPPRLRTGIVEGR